MLFNSYLYICIFLPIVLAGFFVLARLENGVWQRLWLVVASLFFYGWWNPVYLYLLCLSIFFNYACSFLLQSPSQNHLWRQSVLLVGVICNLGLLGYFKYADFFIANINAVLDTDIEFLRVALPLAISFFTFQQLAYLADSYRGERGGQNFLSYCLFVCFFPQLVAGPIVHHREMMPQFSLSGSRLLQWENFAVGVTRCVIGLFKKVVLADTFALWATPGFNSIPDLTFGAAWVTALSYTLQLYFDFSGYTDMALGSARMLNIRLPENFTSPYKSLNIREFWQRWHMTLSRFLRDYLYIPLGGNRISTSRTLLNLFLTFLMGGVWHGAGWTFVVWGMLHGAAAVVHRLWSQSGRKLHPLLAWWLTFVFVVVCWVFFRAPNVSEALRLLQAMAGCNGIAVPLALESVLGSFGWSLFRFGDTFGTLAFPLSYLFMVAGGVFFVAVLPNSGDIVRKASFDRCMAVAGGAMFVVALLLLNRPSEFIYFQF